MDSLSETTLLEAAHEQITEELDELFELPTTSASQEELLEKRLLFMARLSGDDELCGEVRERFLREGRSSGRYALLYKLWSDTPDEAKEPFFVWLYQWTKPPERPKPPWERYATYQGNEEHYREALYNGERSWVTESLPSLAKKWLAELVRLGYRGVEEPSGLPAKERRDESAISRPAGQGEAYPKVAKGSKGQSQALWLRFDGPRSQYGYREIVVSDEPLRTDAAIIAALTALEGRKIVDVAQLSEGLAALKPPLLSVREQWGRILDERTLEEKREGKLPEALKNLQSQQTLDYALLLLKHHRPSLDDFPHEEKLALIVKTCERINAFLAALRKLTAFVEYGVPGSKYLGPAAKDPDRDVKAAVRRDVDGLKHREIGKELEIPLSRNPRDEVEHPAVSAAIARGRAILEDALRRGGLAETGRGHEERGRAP